MPTHFRGICALLIVTVVWGTTFPAMKDLSADFSAVWIAFLRFALGGLLLAPFLRRGGARDYAAGAVLGVVLFTAFMFQVEAISLMNANRNAFITGLNVLIVPLLGVLAGRMPEKRIVAATVLALTGLFALCWDGGSWRGGMSGGDTLALCGALCFGIYVKLMEVLTRKASDMMALTAVQVLTVALCAAAWLAFTASSAQLEWRYIEHGVRGNFANLLYLGVFATALIIAVQTWGQRQTSAYEAAIIYAFEPACAAIAAFFWLNETMTPRAMFGGVLLIAGMVVSQWSPRHSALAAK